MTTTTPTFTSYQRGPEFEAEKLSRCIPAIAAEAVGQVAQEYAKLAERFGQARSRVIALRARLEEVDVQDRVAAEKAIAKGAAVPRMKRPAVEDEIRAAEHECETVVSMIRPSALKLLAATAVIATDTAEKADHDAEAAEAEAITHLESAARALELASSLRRGRRDRARARPGARRGTA
jgi:hypothetical protein